jgi:hypothetical protein
MPPQRLLEGVLWVFDSAHYSMVGAFAEAVREYQVKLTKNSSSWRPDEVVLRAHAVEVLCRVRRGDSDAEPTLTLETEHAEGFTGAELLWRLHEALSREDLGDHRFFEGLSLLEYSPEPDGPPSLYVLRPGS